MQEPADRGRPDACVCYVSSFEELVGARFEGEINALCWRRQLAGDYREIADRLAAEPGITSIDEDDLRALRVSAAGAVARGQLLADQALLRDHGLAPGLDVIMGYPRDDGEGPIRTDVYSFHADRAPVEADTYLCTYAGACSEGLGNAFTRRRIDVPATRAEVLRAYGGPDDAGFEAYCREHSFDLHYDVLPGAAPYSFGIGNLWRIAIAYPGSPVLPCIHRAPLTRPGDPTRLLLIS